MSSTSLRARRDKLLARTTAPAQMKYVSSQIDLILGEQKPKIDRSRPLTPKGRPPPRKEPVFRTIQSKHGVLAFPETSRQVKSRAVEFSTDEVEVVETISEKPDSDIYTTFSLLKTMDAVNWARILDKTPIFLRTLATDGKLEPEIISSICLKLGTSELSRFVSNMSQESNFYWRINSCAAVVDVEKVLCDLLPIKRATIWVLTESADFILSHTMNEVLPLHKSIVGYSIVHNQDIVTGDPGDHPGFNIDVDMHLLRDCRSMMLLPMTTPSNQPVAVLQVVGLFNSVSGKQELFTPYHTEVMKVVRNVIQKRFFSETGTCDINASVTSVFNGFEDTSFKKIVAKIVKFMQDAVPCDVAEIFQFNDREKTMTRISDGAVFDESTGGIAFYAGLTKSHISVYHGQRHPKFQSEIDGLLTNRSILAMSVLSARSHYVVALRAKWKSPAFVPKDLRFLKEVAPLMCDTLRLSKWFEKTSTQINNVRRRKQIVDTICAAVNVVSGTGADPMSVLSNVTAKLFDSEMCFMCEFTGTDMKYTPSNVTRGFDDCVSGRAYNYREVVAFDAEELDRDLYTELNVKMHRAIAFPFRSNGKVVGAVELINADHDSLDELAVEAVGSLTGFLFPRAGQYFELYYE